MPSDVLPLAPWNWVAREERLYSADVGESVGGSREGVVAESIHLPGGQDPEPRGQVADIDADGGLEALLWDHGHLVVYTRDGEGKWQRSGFRWCDGLYRPTEPGRSWLFEKWLPTGIEPNPMVFRWCRNGFVDAEAAGFTHVVGPGMGDGLAPPDRHPLFDPPWKVLPEAKWTWVVRPERRYWVYGARVADRNGVPQGRALYESCLPHSVTPHPRGIVADIDGDGREEAILWDYWLLRVYVCRPRLGWTEADLARVHGVHPPSRPGEMWLFRRSWPFQSDSDVYAFDGESLVQVGHVPPEEVGQEDRPDYL